MVSVADIILFGFILGYLASSLGLLPALVEQIGILVLRGGPVLFVLSALGGARVLRLRLAMLNVPAATAFDRPMIIRNERET